MARANRENEFKQSYNNQGITDNYPQFAKVFGVTTLKITMALVLQTLVRTSNR